jgi:hypothetical protein
VNERPRLKLRSNLSCFGCARAPGFRWAAAGARRRGTTKNTKDTKRRARKRDRSSGSGGGASQRRLGGSPTLAPNDALLCVPEGAMERTFGMFEKGGERTFPPSPAPLPGAAAPWERLGEGGADLKPGAPIGSRTQPTGRPRRSGSFGSNAWGDLTAEPPSPSLSHGAAAWERSRPCKIRLGRVRPSRSGRETDRGGIVLKRTRGTSARGGKLPSPIALVIPSTSPRMTSKRRSWRVCPAGMAAIAAGGH